VKSSPAVGADGTVYVGSNDNNLYAIDAYGNQKWASAFITGGDVFSSPVVGSDGTVYVGSNDHKLYAVYGDSLGLAKSSWPMFHRNPKHTGSMKVAGVGFLPLLLLEE
jgi:hypothetical protein